MTTPREIDEAIAEHRATCIVEAIKVHNDTSFRMSNPEMAFWPDDGGRAARAALDKADRKLRDFILKAIREGNS